MAGFFNLTQMAMTEAYINGLERPDSLFRSMFQTSMLMVIDKSKTDN